MYRFYTAKYSREPSFKWLELFPCSLELDSTNSSFLDLLVLFSLSPQVNKIARVYFGSFSCTGVASWLRALDDGRACLPYFPFLRDRSPTLTVSENSPLLYFILPWWFRWCRICLRCRRPRFDHWVRKTAWRMEWQPTLIFLPGEFHGQSSLQSQTWLYD